MYLECLAIALLGQETGRVCSTDSWTVCLKSSIFYGGISSPVGPVGEGAQHSRQEVPLPPTSPGRPFSSAH